MVTTDQFVNMPKWKQEAIADRVAACKQTLGHKYTFADLMIRTKDKRLVPFVPNKVQVMWLDELHDKHPEFDWRHHKYNIRNCKEDILKARQQGLSTVILVLIFLDTLNNPRTQTIIITDNGERSEMLFKIIHRFWAHLPPHKQPKKKYSSKRELEFTDLDSVIYVGTAGQGTVGRGGTINNVLMSERAYWANGDDVEDGLMESVPAGGNVFRETTANGLNEYYNERQLQHRHDGSSNFEPRFYGWYLSPEYRLPAPPDFVRIEEEIEFCKNYPTKRERERWRIGDIDNDQLEWQRRKKVDRKEMYDVEYPYCEDVAFASSGNPYFDRASLMQRSKELHSGEFEPIPNVVLSKDYIELRNAIATGNLQIWETPNDQYDYIVTNDPSGGLTDRGERDFCSSDVICVQTWEQVAHLHGMWEPRQMSSLLAELGWLYNTALLGVHRKNHGGTVLGHLIHDEKYPQQIGRGGSGIYYMDPFQVYDKVAPSNSDTMLPGFDETHSSKLKMLDYLAEAITDTPGITINSKRSVKECLSFVHLPGSKAGGEAGSHDDCVSSLALGALLLNLRFERKRKTRELLAAMEKQEPSTAWSGYDRR